MWAGDFLHAAKASIETARRGSVVQHFLCCQSIELGLKAYLLLKGRTRKELANTRRFGHQLDRLLKVCESERIGKHVPITDDDRRLIQEAGSWYVNPDKRLPYFQVLDALRGFRDLPPLEQLAELTGRMQPPEMERLYLEA